jgi:hypothetical protein
VDNREEAKRVYHLKGMVMDDRETSLVMNYANQPHCWTRSRIDVPLTLGGVIKKERFAR